MKECIGKMINPFHRSLARSADPQMVLKKGLTILNCDLDFIRNARRIPKSMKEDRDLLVYLVWQKCLLTNEETGKLFNLTYSAVSRVINSMRTRLKREPVLVERYNNIYSIIKM